MAATVQTHRVQELAESGDASPPERYILEESNRLVGDPPACEVPVIDLSYLMSQPDECERLRSALNDWGLFQAVGHGIESSLLDEVRRITREFFKLPMEEKQKYFTTGMEGYGNDRIMSEHQILDWSDRLYLQVQPEEDRKMELWPETPPSFRETLKEYSTQIRLVVDNILEAISMVLGLERSYFVDQLGEKSAAFARFNYYPQCTRPDLVFGIKPHADGSALTVVLQDPEVEGLQVFRDGQWAKVPVIPDALLVNMGDQMEIMSNGIYKSPVHRVVTSPEKDRVSVAVFFAVDYEKEIEPAEALGPRLYKKVKVKEYLEFFFHDFSEGKRSIDRAKV